MLPQLVLLHFLLRRSGSRVRPISVAVPRGLTKSNEVLCEAMLKIILNERTFEIVQHKNISVDKL